MDKKKMALAISAIILPIPGGIFLGVVILHDMYKKAKAQKALAELTREAERLKLYEGRDS